MLHVYITLIQVNHWNGDDDDDYSLSNDYDDDDEAEEDKIDNNHLDYIFFLALVLWNL